MTGVGAELNVRRVRWCRRVVSLQRRRLLRTFVLLLPLLRVFALLVLLGALRGAEGFSHPAVSSTLISPIGWSLFGSTIGVLVMKVVDGGQSATEPEIDVEAQQPLLP